MVLLILIYPIIPFCDFTTTAQSLLYRIGHAADGSMMTYMLMRLALTQQPPPKVEPEWEKGLKLI